MDISELALAKRTLDLLRGADLHTVTDVRAAGREGLIAIDGIGPKTADEILAALPAQEPAADPQELVTALNETDRPILVGHQWLFPGDMRVIRRGQMKQGMVEI